MSDDLLDHFVVEGRELVQQAGDDLLAVAQSGYEQSRIDSAFRAIHTLKGSVGLFDMQPFGAALHAAEDVLAACRGARQPVGAETLDALLDCVGVAETWIESVARMGALPDNAAARASALVAALQRGAGAHDPEPMATAPADWLPPLDDGQDLSAARSAFRYIPTPNCFFLGEDPLALVRQVPALLALHIEPRATVDLSGYDPFACNLVIRGFSAAPADTLRAIFRFLPDQADIADLAANAPATGISASAATETASRTLRVPAERIDSLADLVGELFIAKNRLAFIASRLEGQNALKRELAATQAELDRLAGSLHGAVMGLRLVPLDQSFRRLPRLVRDTASRLGREVAFTIEGEQIQADKTTVDALFEPLLHVLRNALDHGIAPPAERIDAGKPAEGRIALQARLDGERVVIEVSDDGAGIDPAAIRRVAAARGLASPEHLAGLDDDALIDLIFLPGFSTADAVTDISGRGVGMDAVRSALQALGGQVSIAAAPAGGTMVRLSVPQSLTVLTVLTVQAAGGVFGVPVELVAELVRIERDAITALHAGQAFVLRGRTIPLRDLSALLGRPQPPHGKAAAILLANLEGAQIGLEVTGFGTRLDVVLRPLPPLLAATHGVRGSAVLGDGSVLLVLDLAGLVA